MKYAIITIILSRILWCIAQNEEPIELYQLNISPIQSVPIFIQTSDKFFAIFTFGSHKVRFILLLISFFSITFFTSYFTLKSTYKDLILFSCSKILFSFLHSTYILVVLYSSGDTNNIRFQHEEENEPLNNHNWMKLWFETAWKSWTEQQ